MIKNALQNQVKKKISIGLTATMCLTQMLSGAMFSIAANEDNKALGVENGKYYNEDKKISFSQGTAKLDGKEIFTGFTVKDEGKHSLVYTSPEGATTNLEFTIDKTEPLVEGVISGSDYNGARKITFNEGTAQLDNKDFLSAEVVNEEGSHHLVVTDLAGNSTVVDFNIDKTSPVVTGIKNGETYKQSVKISFNEGMGNLNGKSFNNGDTVSEEGQYKLSVIDWAGNKTEISFDISMAPTLNDQIRPVVSNDTKVFSVDDKKFSDEIDKTIYDKNNPVSGLIIEPAVKIDLTDKKEDNVDIVLKGDKVNKIKENNLGLDIQTKDVNIKINSNVISKDLASETPKELIITKAHVEGEDSKKLNGKLVSENPNSKLLGGVMKFNLSVKDDNNNVKNVENFSDKVTVQIKLTDEQLAGIKDKRKAAVYNLLEDGTYVYSGGTIKDGNLEFETEHFSFYIAMENNKTFSDIDNSWAKDEIEVLASRNILKGVDEVSGKFGTKGTITRGQFAIMITKVLSLKPMKYSVVFNDVKEKDYYSNFVLSAYNKGLLKGDGEFFRPDDYISREQMATIIMTSYKKVLRNQQVNGGNAKYYDLNQIAKYALSSVGEASTAGIMKGFPDNTFNPKRNLTREEAAKVIYKFMETANMI